MQHPLMASTVCHVLVSRPGIALLRFFLEGYEGIATVSTVDSALGLVLLRVAPGCEEEVDRILDAERERLGLRVVQWPRLGMDTDRQE